MNYSLYYSRNIGIVNDDEQQILRNSIVFIAGCGGAGGNQAVAIARMGVKEVILMDNGIFDEPDFNRQYAATSNNLGCNKAIATKKMIEEVAPFTKVTAYSEILSEEDLSREIFRSSIVIDAIDVFDFEYKKVFARVARKMGKYNISCPLPELSVILITFSPNGMSFDEFTKGESFPKMTKMALERTSDSPFFSSKSTLSSMAFMSAGLLATEVMIILTGKSSSITCVPFVKKIDLSNNSFRTFNPLVNNSDEK